MSDSLFDQLTESTTVRDDNVAKSDEYIKNRANSLDGKSWTRNSISIWSDLRKTVEETSLKHPAMFPQALASRLIETFTKKEKGFVLDPFVGVGTTVIAARQLGKDGIGIELSENFAKIAAHRAKQGHLLVDESALGTATIHHDDALNLSKHVEPNTVELVVTSPPYWDILNRSRTADFKETRHYGNYENDLGTIGDYKQFLNALAKIFNLVLDAMRPGAYCCVIVMDIRKKDKFYPFHSDIANFMQEIGFIYDDIIIWDRRHEYNNLRPLGYPSVFRVNKVHEFVLIFQKPKKS